MIAENKKLKNMEKGIQKDIQKARRSIDMSNQISEEAKRHEIEMTS